MSGAEPGRRADGVARFVAETTWADLRADARERGKDALLDTLGSALAGVHARASRAVLALVSAEGGVRAATVLTTGRKAPIGRAAFANAMLASVLDFDDGHYWAVGHPGATVVPAALATAEARRRSGRELLCAVVVGYEVAIHAGAILNARPRERLYGAGAAGAYGAGAATARLLGLDRSATRHALGIARCHLPVSTALDSILHGAMTKESVGWGTYTGTMAALLAAEGFTGPPSDLSEPHHGAESELAGLDTLGQRFQITETYIKRYPACLWTHAAVDGALALRRAHGLDATRIDRVIVWTHQRAVAINDPAPPSIEAAQYSLPFTVAAALLDGELGVEQMCESRLGDPRIRALADRVETALDPRLDALFPARRAARVEIHLAGGGSYAREVLSIRGCGEDPLSSEEIDAKFLRLASPGLGPRRAGRVLGLVRDLDRQEDLSPLWGMLSRGRRSAATSGNARHSRTQELTP